MSHPIPGHTYGENEYPEDYKPVRKEFRHTKKAMAKKMKHVDALIHPEKADPNSPLGKLVRLLNEARHQKRGIFRNEHRRDDKF